MTAYKAYVGAAVAVLIAFLGALATATADGSGISTNEWLTAAVVGLTALGGTGYAVYKMPNTAKAPVVEPGTYGEGEDLGDDTYL